MEIKLELNKDYFKSNFIKYNEEDLRSYSFTEETKKFLINFGLPENFKKNKLFGYLFLSSRKVYYTLCK